ncbi:hypothetical protein [Paenibacillus pini]|nr:hypothetical protein [Paenibacillus pini]
MVVHALLSALRAFGVGMVLSHLFYRDRPFVTLDRGKKLNKLSI